MREKDIQNDIRIALNEYAIVFRANVGLYFTRDGRPVNVGLPKGFPDLHGFVRETGKIFFIEVKTDKGKLSSEQINFQQQMKKYPVICGVARSVQDAIRIIKEEK